jgi:O-antigen ligase
VSGSDDGVNKTCIPRGRPVPIVPGRVWRDAEGTGVTRHGSRVWLRMFEVTLTLFIAGFLLTDVYPWLPSFNRLLGGILGLLAISSWLRRRSGVPAEVALFGAFVAWGVVTGFLFAGNQGLVLASGRLLAQELVLVFALTEYARERGAPAFPFFLLLVVPLCMYWYARANGQVVTAQAGGRGDSWRLTSFTANPNYAGFLCLYGLFGLAYFLWYRKRQGLTFWPLLALPFIVITLVLSGSRKSLASFGVFALMWALLAYGRAKAFKARSVLVLVAVAAALYVSGRFVVEKTHAGERFRRSAATPSLDVSRFELYQEGWTMFLQSPVRGVGLGNFVTRSSGAAYAHSDSIEVLATTGFVGFVLYFSIYLVLWLRLRRIRKEHQNATSGYMAGLYQATIMTLLVLGLGAPNFLDPLSLFIVGLMVGHANVMEQDLRSIRSAETRASRGVTSSPPVSVRRISMPSL